jgi:putative flippase GtrA
MQFFFYLIVGGLSFFVDIGAFVAMRAIEVPVIPASISSFILATAANYLLSILLAFERGRFRRHIEMLRFLAVVLVGLGFNTLLVWAFVYELSMHPTVAKIVAVPIVLVWNYLGRRLLVFGNQVPVAVRAWTKPARLLPACRRERGLRRQTSRAAPEQSATRHAVRP